MRIASIILAVVLLALAAPAVSATNEVHLDLQTVYILEGSNATVEVWMDVTDKIDTWSTKIEFDDACVNITDVNFTGSVTPTNASWGHHVDYIYLGGTELDYATGNNLLATITVECRCGCTSPLNFTGEVNVTRLIAGLPDGDPPHGTVYSAAWTNGTVQCVGCGDVTGNSKVNFGDIILLRNHVKYPAGYSLNCERAGDVTGNSKVNFGDIILLRNHVKYPAGYSLNCTRS